jgi:hypothetical protein
VERPASVMTGNKLTRLGVAESKRARNRARRDKAVIVEPDSLLTVLTAG